MNKNSKPGWEIRLETWIRNLQPQAKMIKQRKKAGRGRDKKNQETLIKQKIHLEEINQIFVAKEGKLK